MSFITLLLVVLIQLYCIKHHRAWVDGVFGKVVGWILPKITFLEDYHPYVVLIALIVPVCLIVAILFALVKLVAGPGGHSLLGFLLAFSLMNVYVLSCEKSDTPRIFLLAEKQVFCFIFWFALLGIQGLLMMALVEYIVRENIFNAHKPVQEAAEQLEGWMAWIPQRLMGFSFALVGHFTLAMKDLNQTLWFSWKSSRDFSLKVGEAALYEDKSAAACQRLITHAIWVWLGLLGLISLFSIY